MKHSDRKQRRGSVFLEFTICVPLLVLLFLGAWNYGYAFWLYNTVEQAVRAGGRFASVQTYRAPEGAAPDAAYLTAVRNVVVYGNPAGGKEPIVPSLTTDKVFAQVVFDNKVPSTVRVWVQGYTLPGLFSRIDLQGKPLGAVQVPRTLGAAGDIGTDIMRATVRKGNRRRGTAMLEASLILMLFLLFMFSIFDFAFSTFQRQTILHAARMAARFGVTEEWKCESESCTDPDAVNAIKSMVVYGSPDGGTRGIFGLTPEMVTVTKPGKRRSAGEELVITVSGFPVIFITPGFAGRNTGRPITVSLPMEEYSL